MLKKDEMIEMFMDVYKKYGYFTNHVCDESEYVLREKIKQTKKFNEKKEVIAKLKMILGCKCLRGIMFVEALV